MSTNTIGTFDSALSGAYAWLDEIGEALDYRDRHFALQVLRGVLHALRDRLLVDQSAHLSAQLPLLIRGIYFESWNPEPLPSRDRSLQGFIDRVRASIVDHSNIDLEDAVVAVFGVLKRHITWGEDDKVGKALPHAIAALWNFKAS